MDNISDRYEGLKVRALKNLIDAKASLSWPRLIGDCLISEQWDRYSKQFAIMQRAIDEMIADVSSGREPGEP